MTAAPPEHRESTETRETVPESKVRSLTPAGLVAGGAAAATASVIGGHLGVAGTVIGTFLTSIISAAGVALYSDSITRGQRALRAVGSRARSAGSRRSPAPSGERAEVAARRAPVGRIALLALGMAAIGILAVFGVQRAAGTELSPGTGTIQRSVGGQGAVAPRSPRAPAPEPTDPSSSTDRSAQPSEQSSPAGDASTTGRATPTDGPTRSEQATPDSGRGDATAPSQEPASGTPAPGGQDG